MTFSDALQVAGIIVTSLVAAGIYILQQRLTDKQRIDNRLEVERSIGTKLYDIRYKDFSPKIHLYNVKLLNKKYFAQNKRSRVWGYPFHAAELYAANFDGLEFVTGIKEVKGKKYYQIGVIPYENILAVRPDGDGSFNGMIIYVKPRLVQLDKYSISYKSHRYYQINKK